MKRGCITWKPEWVLCPEAMYLPEEETVITEMSLSWPCKNCCVREIMWRTTMVVPRGNRICSLSGCKIRPSLTLPEITKTRQLAILRQRGQSSSLFAIRKEIEKRGLWSHPVGGFWVGRRGSGTQLSRVAHMAGIYLPLKPITAESSSSCSIVTFVVVLKSLM